MTLGLMVGDDEGLYLATESFQGDRLEDMLEFYKHEGWKDEWPLKAKVHVLQSHPYPAIGLLVSGGICHWNPVVKDYTPQPSVEKAALKIKEVLSALTCEGNEAFCLICGYEKDVDEKIVPKYYHIGRGRGDKRVSKDFIPIMLQPKHIGLDVEGKIAADSANRSNLHKDLALTKAIQDQVSKVIVEKNVMDKPMTGPVWVLVIRPPDSTGKQHVIGPDPMG